MNFILARKGLSLAANFIGEVDLLFLGHKAQHAHHARHHGREVDALRLGQHAAVQTRQSQQIFRDARQALGLLLDITDKFAHGLRVHVLRLQNGVGQKPDARQRRFELVRHVRREFTARLLRCLALGDVESQQHSADRRAACADAADVKLPDTAAALHARLTVPLVHGALDGKAHVVAAVDGQKVLPDAALVRAEELFRRGVDTQHMLFFIEQHKPFAHAACDLRKFRLLALKFVHLLVDLQVLAVDAPEQRGELLVSVVFKRMLKVQLVERLDDAARQALGQNRGQDQCHDQHH